jgi:SAM-dependent MidA family methyltransferase
MREALYGPAGFYHRPEGGPGHHFRTSTSASPHFARAVLHLLAAVDETLGRPDAVELVEVAAARGALLTAVHDLAQSKRPALARRLRLTGVEIAARPPDLPVHVAWVADLADREPVTGLLLANEWLDNVPLDIVEQAAAGPRLVLVDDTGGETLGAPPDDTTTAWLARWWPELADGDRAEVGLPRDESWAAAVRRLTAGLAVAVDYGHVRADRSSAAYAGGTLTGYRAGRQVVPVPDGSCDITAHVALDSVARAGADASGGQAETLLTTQRSALRALGVTGARPDRELASRDPAGYLRALQQAGEQAELTARGGLGDFGWVLHAVGVPLPAIFDDAAPLGDGLHQPAATADGES